MNFENFDWCNKDFEKLHKYMLSNARTEKDIKFEKSIVNTNLTCYAIKSDVINDLVKQIFHGNYISFLEKCEIINYPIAMIYGKILTSLTDYNLFIKFFNKYINYVDCWALCDIFNLKVKKLGKDNIVGFINNNLNSKNLFIRRICIIILLKNFITKENIDYIFNIVNSFYYEKEYYVNMAIAWLLCDCFIKQRDSTLLFIQKNTLNSFVLNKFISKCCDSFRVKTADKIFLKTLRKKEGL